MDINAAMTVQTAIMIDAIGTTATYTTTGGTDYSVTVIFDNEYAVLSAEGADAQGSNPFATGKSSDFADAVQGETLTISDTTYTITEVKPDGTGGVELQLREEEA